MTPEEFVQYLRYAGIHEVRHYRCNVCGLEVSSRHSLSGYCNDVLPYKDPEGALKWKRCTGYLRFIYQLSWEDVWQAERERFYHSGVFTEKQYRAIVEAGPNVP